MDGIPDSEALESRQEFYSRHVVPTEAFTAMYQPFRGRAEVRRIQDLAIASVASTPSRSTHSLERSGYRDEIYLLVSTLGEVVVATDDAEIRLGTGGTWRGWPWSGVWPCFCSSWPT